MPIILESGTDIAGDDYNAFLDMALDWYGFLSLVWRDDDAPRLLDSAIEIRRDLEHHETNRRRANHWPGTRVSSKTPQATVISYRLDHASREVLRRPESLFGWIAPAYPTDLSFYQADGRLAFATATLSRLAWAIDRDFGCSLPKHLGFEARDMELAGEGGFDYVA